MKCNPYFSFNGTAEAAILAYTAAFKGTNQILKYNQMPSDPNYPVPQEMLDKVLHGQLNFGDNVFMFSDMDATMPSTTGNSIAIAIEFDSKDELQCAFDVLKNSDNKSMPPQETFFAESYTNFVDNFGVSWQFTYNVK